MDRTIIAPWKAEERELCEKLYKKLIGLTLLHPPTEDFRKMLNEEMFLKPNQPAFFQVMHYLFKILDPVEFRKRFYWPVNDKKAEANFRSATIQYLKYLDERHQLQWSNIKSYLVQMPGGMKFINFLLNLVSFVIQEQIKQREKCLTNVMDADKVSDIFVTRMRKQNHMFKEYASAYISEADALIAKLKGKTALVKSELMKFSQSTSMDFNQLIDESFAADFEASNRELFVQQFRKPAANIRSLEDSLQGLKEAVEKFLNKKSEPQINEDAVRRSLIKVQQLFPDNAFIDEDFTDSSKTRIGALIMAFNAIHSSIEEQLKKADEIPRCSSFVISELNALQDELQQIESQIMDFQKKLNANIKRKNSEKLQQCTPMGSDATGISRETQRQIKGNGLLAKLVATPPIKFEISDGSRITNNRLPFLDDCALNPERNIVAKAKVGMDTLNNLLALPLSARKAKNTDVSIDLHSTVNRSKIIDPINLLRTISKDTKNTKLLVQHESLNWTWKERQSAFGKDIDATSITTAYECVGKDKDVTVMAFDQSIQRTVSHSLNATCPITPLNTNERTHTARSNGQELSCASENLFQKKKLSAVKKVQDASLNIHNLSTSPSGRLESVIPMDEAFIPKLLMRDRSLSEGRFSENDNVFRDSLNCLKAVLKSPKDATEENNENDGNITNAGPINYAFNMSRCDVENEIFNISDSVLKDVL